MKKTRLATGTHRVGFSLAALASAAIIPISALAFDYDNGDFSLRVNNELGFGAVLRMEDPDPDLIGIANGGNAYSVNSDDGTQNFEKGDLGVAALRLDSRFDASYKNLALTGRVYGRYDPIYDRDETPANQAGRPDFSEATQDRLGARVDMAELYLSYSFNLPNNTVYTSIGRQVLNWGEVLTIPGGINFDPFDVARLGVPGSSVTEAKRGSGMFIVDMDMTETVSAQAFLQYEWRPTLPAAKGSYFATNDWLVPGGDFAMLGFALAPEGAPGATLQRAADNTPEDSGQYGVSFKWYAEHLNDTEFGLVAANYHSRIPYGSGYAFLTTPDTGQYFTDYPEDIHLLGLTFATNIGDWSVGGEWAYRSNLPLQVDEVELFYAGLGFPNQTGAFVGNGNYVQGWRRHKVSQWSLSTLRVWGPNNWFSADSVGLLFEVAANRVHDLPDEDVLRYEGPATYVKGPPDLAGRSPAIQDGGWATDFSWGYRMVLRGEYNNAIGSWAVNPRIQWFHDVDGVTPGNGGAFVEGRQQASFIVNFEAPSNWTVETGYTVYSGGGEANLLGDRDHLSLAVEYSF